MFVDDGSRDGTHAALVRLHDRADNVKVVRLRRNAGKAAALDAGFREAEGDIVVTIDGDLQDDPAEIPRLLAKLDEGFDLVTGWKTRRNDPLVRRVLSRVFNTVTGWLSGLRLHDMNCGLKAFRAEVARELDLYGELHRFIPVLAHDLGFRVTEIAVNHRPREHGRSRYGMERYVRGFLDLLTVTFMGRYRHRPLHLFGGLGLVLSIDRQRDPRLPDDRQADRRGDRSAAAAPARRPARRRRDPVPLARAPLGARHEPAPRADAGAGRSRVAPRRRDPPLTDPSLKVLYFGTYDRVAPRNAQVVSCLRGAGVEVRRAPPRGLGRPELVARRPADVARAPRGARRSRGTRSARRTSSSSAIPGHFDLRAARRIARGRPIVFNPLVSLHDTLVGDRKRFRPWSPAARMLQLVDRGAFRAADLVVADTEAHAAVLPPGVRPPRGPSVDVALVGAEEALFRPGWQPPEPFHVLFVGKLIPLHGLDTILAAAALVPEIPFRVVGDGQLAPLLDDRPANVEHVQWIPYPELPTAYQRAGCALGIFDTGAEGGARDPEQGLPGARVRAAR